ncbi:MAG: response regulator, partial [Acidobacteriota bacterium]
MKSLHVLLIEDDEDDYLVVKELLAASSGYIYEIEWISDYYEARAAIAEKRHEVCLLDYHLGAGTGLELLTHSMDCGCVAPVIFLTGQGDRQLDERAIRAGAADYLDKEQLNQYVLELAIRHAIERKAIELQLEDNRSRTASLLGLYQMKDVSRPMISEFVMQRCKDLTGSDLGFVGFVDEDRGVMTCHSWSWEAMKQCSLPEKVVEFSIKKGGLWAEAIRRKK